MRAAVTTAPNVITMEELALPASPGPEELIVRPELVGLCGSDVHFYGGHLEIAPVEVLFPRVQGHEFAGIVVEVGSAVTSQFRVGERVAVWPLTSCGHCYPCRVGRPSVCDNFSLIGIHTDGALTERIRIPARQAFPTGDLPAALATFVEPIAVGVHAVARARVRRDEQVVVFGGGPIGQAVNLAAQHLGARVMLVEPLAARRETAIRLGAEVAVDPIDDVAQKIDSWVGGEGAAVVLDTSGVPAAIRTAVEIVASAGRVVIVSISNQEVTIPISGFTEKEYDLIGSSCHDPQDFIEAIEIVTSTKSQLTPLLGVEFALEDTEAALKFSHEQPEAALKVMVRVSN